MPRLTYTFVIRVSQEQLQKFSLLIFQRNRIGLLCHGSQVLVIKTDFQEEKLSWNFIPWSSAPTQDPSATVMTALAPLRLSRRDAVVRDGTINPFVQICPLLGIFPQWK